MTHVDTYDVETDVPVPPYTYVNATYVVMEENFEATWSTDVYFTGCLMTQMYWGYFDGNLYYDQISTVFDTLPGVTCERNNESTKWCDNYICKFTVKGSYKGAGGAKASLLTSSAPCNAK